MEKLYHRRSKLDHTDVFNFRDATAIEIRAALAGRLPLEPVAKKPNVIE
jgi:hypothetical protein